MKQEEQSIFTAAYWRMARGEVKNLRRLALAALVVALDILLGYFHIPVGENLNIYFNFLVKALGAAVYGPVMAMLVGAATDTLGFVLNSGGYPYFPGYLLGEVLAGLVWGLALYRRRVSILRLALARAVLDYGVNVLLGSLWSSMLYGKGYYYFAASSLVKNTLLLPLEVALLVLLWRYAAPALRHTGALPAGPARVPWR